MISTYGLETIGTLPSPSSHVANLAFNENDSILSLVSSDGFHQRYDLLSLKKRGEAFIDKNIEYKDIIYLQDIQDEVLCLSVG